MYKRTVPQSGYKIYNEWYLIKEKMFTYPHVKSLAQFLKIKDLHTNTEAV